MSQQQFNVNVDLSQATDIVCEKCGSRYFRQALFLKKVSKFMTGGDQDALIPIQVLRCDDCGHTNEDMMPLDSPREDKDDSSQDSSSKIIT